MPTALLSRSATAHKTRRPALTGQRRNGLAIALGSPQLLPSGEICEQSLLAETGGQDAPILAERNASSRIDGLQRALHLVRRPDSRSLRHGVALVCFEPRDLLRDARSWKVRKVSRRLIDKQGRRAASPGRMSSETGQGTTTPPRPRLLCILSSSTSNVSETAHEQRL